MTIFQLDAWERAALTALAIGLTQEAAARRLGISSRTLRRCFDRAAHKLGACSAIHAVALAAADGQLDPAHLRARTLPPWPGPRGPGGRVRRRPRTVIGLARVG